MGSEPDETASSFYPLVFRTGAARGGAQAYLRDDATRALLTFFESKGLAAIKDEDRREAWYADWIEFQARHGLYAEVLSPAAYSARGATFDLLRYARFLEVFAGCSPGHGYSVQVTFLGLFSILMGTNEALKREAVARLEAGELLAFGVSEQRHGSDLVANEFRFSVPPPPADGEPAPRRLEANGTKYYIGNSNVATLIATLGKMDSGGDAERRVHVGHIPLVLAALRPARGTATWSERKIQTLGVRAAHVGAFEVRNHPIADGDIIAEGRAAWDAVFGTVTLGKFFLGFGSIGICERALDEAATHLRERKLYGKPAIDMGHLRAMMAEAYARVLAMKLYAYRAIDYLRAASPQDRRYLLFCAVQKAKVSTEGVKVMGLISECVGAKGFEGDTFCEMAQRDVTLIPGLEGSKHINLGLAAQFLPRYFARGSTVTLPPSVAADEAASGENAYLMAARGGGTQAIRFGWFLQAYRAFRGQPNVILFARQAAGVRRFVNGFYRRFDRTDLRLSVALGKCIDTLVYGQLIAENAAMLKLPAELLGCLLALQITDINRAVEELVAIGAMDSRSASTISTLPRSDNATWAKIAERARAFGI